ncbi:hypothetical protein LZ30DRAFT_717784 [Colletotrichum cereale]|nr:hypothetical protein LZ30DRAFT_717784 [Colletotrichum cereale]
MSFRKNRFQKWGEWSDNQWSIISTARQAGNDTNRHEGRNASRQEGRQAGKLRRVVCQMCLPILFFSIC